MQLTMKVITVVGARPNFMKAAPILAAIREHNASTRGGALHIDHVLVHTGQHYDSRMSGTFFEDLRLPAPDVQLGVGSGSHGEQTADVLRKFEQVLVQNRPDVVIVVGDVNSTVACALATAKISFDAYGTRPVLAHVEAGLRSFDRAMPEEINRVVTDHVADLLFVTEASGVRNLLAEGISREAIAFVGNTMIDSLLACQHMADQSRVLQQLGLRSAAGSIVPYGLLTLHRPSNVDHSETLRNILAGLDECGAEFPFIFPVHPRTRLRLAQFGFDGRLPASIRPDAEASAGPEPGLVLTEPLGYLDFLCLMKNASIVVTDSGGIQEETTCLGVPCVTVRDSTERPVTVDLGTNVVVGTSADRIQSAIRNQFGRRHTGPAPELWDGRAAGRILERLMQTFEEKRLPGLLMTAHP